MSNAIVIYLDGKTPKLIGEPDTPRIDINYLERRGHKIIAEAKFPGDYSNFESYEKSVKDLLIKSNSELNQDNLKKGLEDIGAEKVEFGGSISESRLHWV